MPADSVFYEEGQKEYISLQGTVYKKVHTSDYQILYLKNNSIIYYDQTYYESRILIYDENFIDVKIGNLVYASGKAKAFERAHNPGNFNSKVYYARSGLYGSLWCENLQVLSGRVNRVSEGLFKLKQKWSEYILRYAGEVQGGVLNAMLTGEKSAMEDDIKDLYQKNGLSHILAISGLHISFLGLGIYQILRKLGVSFGVSGAISGGVLIAYVVMIGAPVSAFRALVMLLLRIGADIFGRIFDMATAFLLSACMIVAYEPLYLTDAGFLLSYGAIVGILLVKPTLENVLWTWCVRIPGFTVSVAVQIVLFPLLLYFYFEIPVYAIVFNLLIVPLMSVVLSLGMIGSLFCVIWEPAGALLFRGCGWLLSFFEGLNRMGMKLPVSRISFGQPSVLWIVGYYVTLLVVILLFGKQRNENRKYGFYVCTLLLGFCLTTYNQYDVKGDVQVTFLDVGQGDCIVLRGPENGVYLIDGGSSDVSNVGEYRITPYLKSQGITEVKYVFVTHGDGDHYSGIAELLSDANKDIRIQTLVLPAVYQSQKALCELRDLARKQGVSVACMEPKMVLKEGCLSIACIQPNGDMEGKDGNENSLVLDVTFGEIDFLFTGDVEKEGEVLLAENLRFSKGYEVLKVAHHGSRNSSTEEVLEKIKPEIAIICAGRDNSYGHPHVETLVRLQRWTSQIYSTAVSGAITIKTDGNRISITGFH